jgi:hypothetical protein
MWRMWRRSRVRQRPGSGDVQSQGQLIRRPDYLEKSFEGFAQVGNGLFLRRSVADCANARPELGGGAPNAFLILLDDVGHVNDTSHSSEYGTSSWL